MDSLHLPSNTFYQPYLDYICTLLSGPVMGIGQSNINLASNTDVSLLIFFIKILTKSSRGSKLTQVSGGCDRELCDDSINAIPCDECGNLYRGIREVVKRYGEVLVS